MFQVKYIDSEYKYIILCGRQKLVYISIKSFGLIGIEELMNRNI